MTITEGTWSLNAVSDSDSFQSLPVGQYLNKATDLTSPTNQQMLSSFEYGPSAGIAFLKSNFSVELTKHQWGSGESDYMVSETIYENFDIVLLDGDYSNNIAIVSLDLEVSASDSQSSQSLKELADLKILRTEYTYDFHSVSANITKLTNFELET
jgi:hypothetical protein